MSPVFANGVGTSSGLSALASGVSGDTTAIVVQQETAVVRSIDLRARTSADGDAWIVLLVGSAFFLVAFGFLVVWLQARIRRVTAAAVPVRVNRQRTAMAAIPEPLDRYPV